MQLRYQYRLYPTPGQRTAPARAFGCARTVFNDGLCLRQEARGQGLPYVSDAELSKRVITQAKQTPQRAWLCEVSAVVPQQALADLNTAYRNFFASITGRRKGPKIAAPRYRSREDRRQAIRFTRNARFAITAGGRLRLPKIGDVPVRWSRDLPSEPSSVTVIKGAAGRCFASFLVEASDEPLPEAASEVGIRRAFVADPELLKQYIDGAFGAEVMAEHVDAAIGLCVRQGFTERDAFAVYELLSECALGAAISEIRAVRADRVADVPAGVAVRHGADRQEIVRLVRSAASDPQG